MKRTIKKAQGGYKIDMTAMTKAMAKNKDIKPSDTLAVNDRRREDFGNIDKLDKRDQKKIADLDKAFDKKYGKGKPAKQKMGGVTAPKAKKAAAKKPAVMAKSSKMGMMKKGGKMSKKK